MSGAPFWNTDSDNVFEEVASSESSEDEKPDSDNENPDQEKLTKTTNSLKPYWDLKEDHTWKNVLAE